MRASGQVPMDTGISLLMPSGDFYPGQIFSIPLRVSYNPKHAAMLGPIYLFLLKSRPLPIQALLCLPMLLKSSRERGPHHPGHRVVGGGEWVERGERAPPALRGPHRHRLPAPAQPQRHVHPTFLASPFRPTRLRLGGRASL